MRRRSLATFALAAALFGATLPGATAPAGAATTRPDRILCLSASATQMLYSIGAGKQVVGVDKYSTYPPNAPRTAFTGYESSAEAYLRLRPDLVILAFDPGHLVAQLHELHIATLLLPPASNVTAAEQQITELGAATGHVRAARAEIASLNTQLNAIAKSVGSRARGRTYYVEVDPTLYAPSSKTFVGSLFSRLGMRDIADAAAKAGATYPQLSAEYLLKANPDYVFLADTVCCGQRPATFAKRPGFSVLTAVRQHHVFAINDSLVSQWGPHTLVQFFALLAGVLKGPHAMKAAA